MVQYLTEGAFRLAGLGADLSIYSDAELRNILIAASTQVNAYCGMANLPQPHDFRGGTISNERHEWNIGGPSRVGQRRIYPWHQPLISVDSFQIKVTENNYIVIQPSDTVINNSGGYIEIVALTLGIGVFPQLANLTLSVPLATIGYTYGWSFPVSGEQLLESDGQTFRAANQYWDAKVTPKVYIDGADHTSDFTIDLTEGTATNATELDAEAVVTADYAFTLPQNIARATGVIATGLIGQSQIMARGMSGLNMLRVAPGEIEMRRGGTATLPPRGGDMPPIPDEAAWLLEPFRKL